jgi:histidinol-phosphate aminotransferase
MTKEAASLVRKAVREATPYHLDRHDVPIKLDQNENNLGVPDSLRRELMAALERLPLHRYPTPGQPEIRDLLSKRNDWPAEGILVGNGSDDLLHTLALAFLEPGRKAVVPTPSFFAYGYNARLMGADVVEVPLDERLRYDVGALGAAIDEHAPAVVFLCSPNNPTGTAMEPEEIETIVERASGIVVLDEAYWEFCSWNARTLLDSHENLVLMRTFSKAMAMAGMRLGYLLAAPSLAKELRKAQQPYPLNRFSQEAARVAFEHYPLLRERASLLVAEREKLYQRLSRMSGVEVYPSKANFLLFRTSLGAKKTYEGLLARGVLVRDVSRHPRLPGMLRVAIGTAPENESFHSALEEILRPLEELQ